MKILGKHKISPGEIWAVTGTDAAVRSAWCTRIVRDEELADVTALLSFAQQAEEDGRIGWPQARYYGEAGRTVAEFLSFDVIYEVNPFEVGARHPETRRAYRERLDALIDLLDLQRFWNRPVIALSNGERAAYFSRGRSHGTPSCWCWTIRPPDWTRGSRPA